MMCSDKDKLAQEERANRLRKQIKTIVKGNDADRADDGELEGPSAESPHEFTQRRMRELAERQRKSRSDSEQDS